MDDYAYGSERNQLLAFGTNENGQLGLGHRYHVSEPTSPRLGALLKPGDSIAKVFTGCNSGHVIVLSSHGVIIGWGSNEHGQLGLAPSPAVEPVVLGGDVIGPVSQVAIGASHTLVLTRRNELFRLMKGSIEEVTHPHLHILAIAAGFDFSLISVEDGRAFTLANDQESFEGFTIRGFVAAVAACQHQGYLLTAEGSIWAWGDNNNGQLLGSTLQTASRQFPYQSSAETEFGTIVSVRPGERVTLALTDDGSLLSYRQSGLEKLQFREDSGKVISYSVGVDHAVVTLANGDVEVWGMNDHDQLGSFNTKSTSHPQKLFLTAQNDRKYAEAAAGKYFSILLAACPDVKCVHGIASPSDGCACVCDLGWSGSDCSLCERTADFCSLHGSLSEHDCKCNCEAPWQGDQCSVCGLQCEHGAASITNGTCTCACDDQWGGTLCNTCMLQSTQCYQGTLDSSSCSCNCREPWMGDYCNRCGLTPEDCSNGVLNTEKCVCECQGEWSGAQCDVCGIGELTDVVCHNVTMWNSVGQGWQGHALHITDGQGNAVARTTLESGAFGKEEICLAPGAYSVYACGPPHTDSLFNGWQIMDVQGRTSESCSHHSQTLIVSGGGCNMGEIDKATCSCNCNGNWQGEHECVVFEVDMSETFHDAWKGSQLIFEDQHGRWVRTLDGSTGRRQVCLPDGELNVFACRTTESTVSLSPDATMSWTVSLGPFEVQGSSGAETFCDMAQAEAVRMNVSEALQPMVPLSVEKALSNMGVQSVRPSIVHTRQVSGFCSTCDVLGKCVHGAFHDDCSCKCEELWTGPLCDTCGMTLAGFPVGHARIDTKRCVAHCVGGWTGSKCDICGLVDSHCDGIVDRQTCTCKAVEVESDSGSTSTSTSADSSDSAGSSSSSSAPPPPVRQCHHPWTGPDCSVCPRPTDFCHHSGVLKDCVCDCHIPWMGEDCSVCAIQDQSCHNGKRNANMCACDCSGGWTGLFCDECTVSCGSNGRVNEDCECDCSHGWTGPHCDVCHVADGDCVHGNKNDATCQCECEPGWAGKHCDECVLASCGHGVVDHNTCECACEAPWIGSHCDACGRTNSDCVHGTVNTTCDCSCDESWEGELCDVCPFGEHSCVHGFFQAELCRCTCPEHRSGLFCERCDLTPDICGGSVNMNHCVCNMVVPDPSTPSATPEPTETLSSDHIAVATSESTATPSIVPTSTAVAPDEPTATPGPVPTLQRIQSPLPSKSPLPLPSSAPPPSRADLALDLSSLTYIDYDTTMMFGDVATSPYSVTIQGGAKIAFAQPLVISQATHISFDVHVSKACARHGFALFRSMRNGQPMPGQVNFLVAGYKQAGRSDVEVEVAFSPDGSVPWQSVEVPVGLSVRPGGYEYFAVFAECANGETAETQIANIRLHESKTSVDLKSHIVPFGDDRGVAVVNGTSLVHLYGPSSKVLPLLSQHIMSPSTMLHLDFRGNTTCASQMVGLSTSISSPVSQRFLQLNGFIGTSAINVDYSVLSPYKGGWKHYDIPVGRYYEAGTTFPFIALVSACSASSFANIHVSDPAASLVFSMLQVHTYDSDKDVNPSVVAQGSEISLSEVSWKAVSLLRPVNVRRSTHIEFDVYISHVCGLHGIALVKSLDSAFEGHHMRIAGTGHVDSTWIDLPGGYSMGWKHFNIPIGELYESGSYPYLALIHECQCGHEHCEGTSTFANVRIFNVMKSEG